MLLILYLLININNYDLNKVNKCNFALNVHCLYYYNGLCKLRLYACYHSWTYFIKFLYVTKSTACTVYDIINAHAIYTTCTKNVGVVFLTWKKFKIQMYNVNRIGAKYCI